MSLGPIMASGGLAIMIPPSALGVLLAALAQFPVGDFLVAIIVPGLLMSLAYTAYIVLRCYLNTALAPSYAVKTEMPFFAKFGNAVIYIFPLFFIMFVVVGLIFLGVATPTEAAALGALSTYLLAFMYRGLSLAMIRDSLLSSMRITVMLLMIITGSTAFSQVLAFTGATSGLANLATSAHVAPIVVVIIMQIVLIFLGMFMEPLSIMMLTVPIYFPVIQAFDYDPIWFGAIMLLNMEMATISPPFGFNLFIMRGVGPRGVTMGQIYAASVPFLLLDLLVIAMLLAFPGLVLWLPTFIAH
jgi:tripartite ATP-independent transporter DctM subunit